jgi:hypothetical protein
MVDVGPRVQARIDHYLECLTTEWASIPDVAREWPSLQRHERADFILEWPIQEDRLLQLRRYAEQGAMTPEQRARYEAVLELVALNRPTLETLLQD